jgi:hypothetical protein
MGETNYGQWKTSGGDVPTQDGVRVTDGNGNGGTFRSGQIIKD